jgi:uncharacterized phiE125 gp8 family phage protein
VTTAEAKAFANIDTSDDDTLIGSLITAAREKAENHSNLSLLVQAGPTYSTYEFYIDSWPASRAIRLPIGPVQTVDLLDYIATATTDHTYTTGFTDFHVDAINTWGRLRLDHGASWPDVRTQELNPIRITYDAGFGLAASVPEAIKTYIKRVVAYWYEQRPEGECFKIWPTPLGLDALLEPYTREYAGLVNYAG